MPYVLSARGKPLAPVSQKPLRPLVAATRERVRELTYSPLMPTIEVFVVPTAPSGVHLFVWPRPHGRPEGSAPQARTRHIVWHQAGSGKSNTVARWAHRLGEATHLEKQAAHLLAVTREIGWGVDLWPQVSSRASWKDQLWLSFYGALSKPRAAAAVLSTLFTRLASELARALGISRRDARLVLSALSAEALIARLLFSFRHRLARLEALPCRGREHRRAPLCSARTLNAPPCPLLVYERVEDGRSLGLKYTLTA